MSTYWGLRCDAHDPPLHSDYGFNHQPEALERLVANRDRWPVDFEGDAVDLPDVPGWAKSFLIYEHPRCALTVVNEYGATVAEWRAEMPARR